jgi:hypothetical protein
VAGFALERALRRGLGEGVEVEIAALGAVERVEVRVREVDEVILRDDAAEVDVRRRHRLGLVEETVRRGARGLVQGDVRPCRLARF